MTYHWFVYREAGTYPGTAQLEGDASPEARLSIPHDAAGKTIHVLLTLTDDGKLPLTSYRRLVVHVSNE